MTGKTGTKMSIKEEMATVKYARQRSSPCRSLPSISWCRFGGRACKSGKITEMTRFLLFLYNFIFMRILSINLAILNFWTSPQGGRLLPGNTNTFSPAEIPLTEGPLIASKIRWKENNIEKTKNGKNREAYFCNQDHVNHLLFSSRVSWSGHESSWSLRSKKNSSESQRA